MFTRAWSRWCLGGARSWRKTTGFWFDISWGHNRIEKVQLIICTPLGMVLYSIDLRYFSFNENDVFIVAFPTAPCLFSYYAVICTGFGRAFTCNLHLISQKNYRTLLWRGRRWQQFDGIVKCIRSASFSFLFWWIAVKAFCKDWNVLLMVRLEWATVLQARSVQRQNEITAAIYILHALPKTASPCPLSIS